MQVFSTKLDRAPTRHALLLLVAVVCLQTTCARTQPHTTDALSISLTQTGPATQRVTLPPFHILDFETDHGAACAARFGTVILSVDETMEWEFKRYFSFHDGVAVYHTRQYKGPDIDVNSLQKEKALITNTSMLLPPFEFDAIGFACTSDAAVLGSGEIAKLVAEGAPVAPDAVTDPLHAAIRAFHALNVTNVAVLTPYTEDITAKLVTIFDDHGVTVTSVGYFNQTADAVVARIRPRSVVAAVEHLVALDGGRAQAVFVSCTNTRTVDIIADAERSTGLPMVSSNSALAWDMLRLGGQLTPEAQRTLSVFGGKLYGVPVAAQGPRHTCP